ncbi:hypothetical protein [Hymenobacter cavernae]|nr:hypothetical protein [Hymenobacter cavernae]
MARFLVSLRLPDVFDDALMEIIPRHRAFINHLIAENVVETYAISADRARGWVTMNGEDADEVRAVVEQFPLYDFFSHIEIDELFLFDSVATRLPRISLN